MEDDNELPADEILSRYGDTINFHLDNIIDPPNDDGEMNLLEQSHRYGHPQAACREPAGSYDKTTRTAICFEHKTQYLLIRAPYTRIVIFSHISDIPHHDFAESN